VKKQRSIFLFFLIIVFLISTVGVGIFSHTCKIEGVQTSYFIPGEHNCDTKEAKETHPCCKVKKQETKEDDCCNDEQTVVQLDIDIHSNSFQKALPHVQSLLVPESFSSGIITNTNYASNFKKARGNPPPLKYQDRHIHLLFQQFII
jgi:hypothetical protein